MGKLIISVSLTLDGVMQSPGFDGEDSEGNFEHGGWIAPYWDEQASEITFEDLNNAGAFLLGRKTYDIWAKYWPNAPKEEADVAKLMNGLPKYVVTNSSLSAKWENTTVISGDVVELIKKLKDRISKNILVGGSGQLAQTLMASNLVDSYELMIVPLILGSGKKLFREDVPTQKLDLTDRTVTSTGVAVLKYQVLK